MTGAPRFEPLPPAVEASRARARATAEPLGSPFAPRSLVDAAVVATYLGVERGWVYHHASELGARRLGSGPKARLRFSLEEIERRLTSCPQGRRPEQGSHPVVEPAPHRRNRPRLGTAVPLLPIRDRK